MLKLLLKKQISEFIASLIVIGQKSKSNANAKAKSPKGKIILISVLFLYVFIVTGVMFFFLGDYMCNSFSQLKNLGIDITWLYFSLFAILTLILCTVTGSIATSSKLFEAKDNDFLFSLPIKPTTILLSRVVEVHILNTAITSLFFIPAYIAYFNHFDISFWAVLGIVLSILFFPLVSTAISCLIGWIISTCSSRFKRKNLFKIILSFSLLGFYFYFTSMSGSEMTNIISSFITEGNANNIKSFVYPLYSFGVGCTGDVLHLIGFAIGSVLLIAVVLFILSKNYVRISTSSSKVSKKKFDAKKIKATSIFGTLVKKEYKRFFGTAIYFINCALGAVMAIAMGVIVMIKKEAIFVMLGNISTAEEYLLPIMCASCAFFSCVSPVSAPSVSLEGESLWVLRSLPISTEKILIVKIAVHYIFVQIPFLFMSSAVALAFKFSIFESLALFLFGALFILFVDLVGIWTSIRFPNLNWTNETAAVKQSTSVLITIFAGMGLVLFLGILFIFLKTYIPVLPLVWAGNCFLILVVIFMAFLVKTKGTKRFESL